jgi:hypothetical protein
MAAVAPMDEAKDIIVIAINGSKIAPANKPKINATGIDNITRTTYTEA